MERKINENLTVLTSYGRSATSCHYHRNTNCELKFSKLTYFFSYFTYTKYLLSYFYYRSLDLCKMILHTSTVFGSRSGETERFTKMPNFS